MRWLAGAGAAVVAIVLFAGCQTSENQAAAKTLADNPAPLQIAPDPIRPVTGTNGEALISPPAP